METLECHRFTKSDLTSDHGQMSWEIGEWRKVSGRIVCGSNGLHASATPRDSLKYVYGERWFIAEAKGEFDKQDSQFAAREMRLVTEIPKIVLQRFATWCAKDCLGLFRAKYPNDNLLTDCIQMAEASLDGAIDINDVVARTREVTAALLPTDAARGPTARVVAATVAAATAISAPNTAAWTSAAAAAAHAVHTATAAHHAAIASAEAQDGATNVASLTAAAATANVAARLAHIASAAGALAHASAVAAARNVTLPDTTTDAYYAAFAAYSFCPSDTFIAAQNEKLTELIEQHLRGGWQ